MDASNLNDMDAETLKGWTDNPYALRKTQSLAKWNADPVSVSNLGIVVLNRA